MPDLSIGLSCPTCGGAIQVVEGESTIICGYCGSVLFVEGDKGVFTIAFKSNIHRETATAAVFGWWKKGMKARDLQMTGKILEVYPIYLPFWSAKTRVVGWVCGYEERHYTDKNGNVRTEKIPKEQMVLQDYPFSEIACDPGDLGIRTLKNFNGEATYEDFEMIPTFESTTSKDDAVSHAKTQAINQGRASAHVPHVTFEKLHAFPRKLSLIYYPVWVVRYSYRDRMYMATVDGVTGMVLSGRAPGDPLYQSLAVTSGTSIGGIVAAGAIIAGNGMDDIRVSIIGIVIGLVIVGVSYLFFRHGSERVQGEFKDKKGVGQAVQQMQQLGKQLGGI